MCFIDINFVFCFKNNYLRGVFSSTNLETIAALRNQFEALKTQNTAEIGRIDDHHRNIHTQLEQVLTQRVLELNDALATSQSQSTQLKSLVVRPLSICFYRVYRQLLWDFCFPKLFYSHLFVWLIITIILLCFVFSFFSSFIFHSFLSTFFCQETLKNQIAITESSHRSSQSEWDIAKQEFVHANEALQLSLTAHETELHNAFDKITSDYATLTTTHNCLTLAQTSQEEKLHATQVDLMNALGEVSRLHSATVSAEKYFLDQLEKCHANISSLELDLRNAQTEISQLEAVATKNAANQVEIDKQVRSYSKI